jgi:hypothetical protein
MELSVPLLTIEQSGRPQIVAEIPGLERCKPLYINIIPIYWDNKYPTAAEQTFVRCVNDGVDI